MYDEDLGFITQDAILQIYCLIKTINLTENVNTFSNFRIYLFGPLR